MQLRKRNIKGYALIEIIVAFVIAFGIAFFIISLTIKSKTKNDDLMVESLVTTDQAIIANKLMDLVVLYKENFDCDSITYENNVIKYNDETVGIVNEYTKIDVERARDNCQVKDGKISIDIPLIVKQLKDKKFNVKLDYKYAIGD